MKFITFVNRIFLQSSDVFFKAVFPVENFSPTYRIFRCLPDSLSLSPSSRSLSSLHYICAAKARRRVISRVTVLKSCLTRSRISILLPAKFKTLGRKKDWFFTPCKVIRDNHGLQTPCCLFQIPRTGFQIPTQWIPDSRRAGFQILDS